MLESIFNNDAGLQPARFLKGDSNTGALREGSPNAELFLVRVFLYSDWILGDTELWSLKNTYIEEHLQTTACGAIL